MTAPEHPGGRPPDAVFAEFDSAADALAALIRELDGGHSLGAGELAEALASRGVRLAGPVAPPTEGEPDDARELLDYLSDMVSDEDVVFRRTRNPELYAGDLGKAHEIEVPLYEDETCTAEEALRRDFQKNGVTEP